MASKARIRSVIEPVGPFALFVMRRSLLAVGFGPARLEIRPTGQGSPTTPEACPKHHLEPSKMHSGGCYRAARREL